MAHYELVQTVGKVLQEGTAEFKVTNPSFSAPWDRKQDW